MLRKILFLWFMFYLAPAAAAAENMNSQSPPAAKPLKLSFEAKPEQEKSSAAEAASPKEHLAKRLDRLVKALGKDHKAVKALKLRQAHILSLIAEENQIKFEKEKCGPCAQRAKASAKDSLFIYKQLDSLLSEKHSLLHAEALFKQAYLFRILDNKPRALAKLRNIVKKKDIKPLMAARAWFLLGELYFELYDYEQSLKAFNEVLKYKETPWRFKASYRKVWALSNLSFYESSVHQLEAFLTSDLYSRSSASLEERRLKDKLETELVILYSYVKVTEDRLNFIYSFSKQDESRNSPKERNQRLFDLAEALQRIGRRGDSNKVWRMYVSKADNNFDKLEAYSFILNNDLNSEKKNFLVETGKIMENIFSLMSASAHSADFLNSFNKQAKVFFRKIGSPLKLSVAGKKYLLNLYYKYNIFYPKDINILSQSAVLAFNLKDYAKAQDLFQKAVLNMDFYRVEKKNASKKDIKEAMSRRQMEAAELTKKESGRLQAYNFYIKHGAEETLIFKAQYQKAYISYQNKDYESAARSFSDLALYKAGKGALKDKEGLRLKSAHLCLSALDQLGGREEDMLQWAGLFMKEFPENEKEFGKIFNTAVLNIVKKLVSGKDFSAQPVQASADESILKAWSILQKMFVKAAEREMLLAYHMNRLLLAKELLKFDEMDQSLKALLSSKDLKKEDRKTALLWSLWLAELRFDFKEMLRIIKILQPDDQSEEQLLRQARLAELSGQTPIPYYKTFIEKFPKSKSLAAVAVSLIEKAPVKDKKAFLKQYASLFRAAPGKLAYLVLKVDEGRLKDEFINTFARMDFMKDSSLKLFMDRKGLIESFEKDLAGVQNYSLSPRLSGRRLARAIKKYTKEIDALGDAASAALKTADWTARVFIISLWKKEVLRFYQSVINLPLPKGLSEEEKKEYMSLLAARMQPYKEQTAQLEKEVDNLWSRGFTADYQRSFQQGRVFYPPLKWEISKILSIAEGEHKKQVQLLLDSFKVPEEPAAAAAAKSRAIKLYSMLKVKPFDKESLLELLELEKENDNEVLVYYLTNRIKELEKAKGRIKL